VPLAVPPERNVPFADLRFPTPSGRIELRSEALAVAGLDPLPDYAPPAELAERDAGHDAKLVLISGASHHFVTSSMANQSSLLAKEGTPFIEINPSDAVARGITDGDDVIVESARGWCTLRATVTANVRPGVAVSPKGRWASLSTDGRNINW